jgi:hypothetical protein
MDSSTSLTRRLLLERGLLAAAGLTFVPSLMPRAWGAQAASAACGGRAKAVIQIWLWGGACHIDTFDPKPDAGRDYTGPLDKAVSTNVDGIQVGELLPLLARQADKYSLIRSMTHGVNGHETASYLVQTGRKAGERLVYPCIGAVVSRFKGYDAGYKGFIPPYVVLTTPLGRFSEAGFLGSKYKPFATGGDPARDHFAVEGIVAEGISEERQKARRDLLHELDALGRAMPGNPLFQQMDRCEENAYGVILGDSARLFDLTTEKDDLRQRYGKNTFGQSCLMARRLVEAGIQYVSINYKGWDTHKQHFETMRRKLPELDQGLATLLTDLSDRGLLDSTIVWCCGEFGRTPRVQWEAPWNGGRGHHGECFSALLAGGGFKGGHVVGASDSKGERVTARPVYPHDVIGSMYELLGIDPDGSLPHPAGLQVRVTPSAEEGVVSGGRLKEIM